MIILPIKEDVDKSTLDMWKTAFVFAEKYPAGIRQMSVNPDGSINIIYHGMREGMVIINKDRSVDSTF